MSAIVLHGFVPFDRSGRIRWLLHEMDRPFEFRKLDYSAGDSRSPEFLALSPCGKVPVLEDGDTVVFESGAGLLHLADRYGDGKFGPGPGDPARGDFLSWMFLASATLDPICFELVRPDLPEEETGPRVERAKKELPRILDAIAGKLGEGETLLASGFSALDVQVAASLHYADRDGILDGHPTVKAYLERMRDRKGAIEAGIFPT